jgi:selenocysteine-specific elongation factor
VRVVATAGHVDHGKSSLVLALTGTDPDRFAEEKRRGLTIDLGFAHLVLPTGEEIGLVDVPGHVRFLRNMLAGVGGVDACLFVVAATEGWKPQSEEHLRILQLLGLRRGVVVLSKRDLVDDEWLELQALDVADHLAGTFLTDAPIIPVSSTTGAGLDDLRAALDVLVATTAPSADRGRPRVWVDRSFAAKGSGTVITGTLTGGSLRVDDRVDVEPAGVTARIRSIQSHGRTFDALGPGHRVALNLGGVEHQAITRGDAVVHGAQWRPTRRVDASLEVLASLDHEVSRRGAYVAYIGSGEWPVKVRILGDRPLLPGETGAVRLHLGTALPLVAGDRFVLRESGRNETVGGGEVLDVEPVLPASKARPDRDVARVVRERGWVRVDVLAALTGAEMAPTLGDWVVDPALLAATRDGLAARVAQAGAAGVELAQLDERERLVAATLEGTIAGAGRLRPADAVDEFADHPLAAALAAGGAAPPDIALADRGALRELVRRGVAVERDGIAFHISAIESAALTMADLLAAHPGGVTLAQFRDALGVTRKHAVPLATELDARGITRRRDDLRIAGPRLPSR